MSGMGDDEEEYEGPVTLVFGDDRPVEAEAHIAGHFDPLTGDYRWIGRISASPGVTAEYQAGNTAVLVRTADGHEASGTLTETNPWGGHRLTGRGRPPFPVPEVDPAED
ncbi:DUF4873 domain-containing protein [Nocardiopsis composta]|uniref:DUF4873 domain-containing protein n=1 Tax=Nocardiopsis composta TaxID=157465 RepID=A0A7W8QR57_9ACTN|nr:DUF4873 domain-containing protein [Nocardiopsis composta]MBB5434944.1 hypothetical protein [Nocardiopsis composta]